jgi:hypothetical protein
VVRVLDKSDDHLVQKAQLTLQEVQFPALKKKAVEYYRD